MDDRQKHLEFIQAVINRMASNSFLFKGWSITIIAGLSAFSAQNSNKYLLIVSAVATLMFWGVDAYYLMKERAFRDLYDTVAKKDPKKIDFRMKTSDTDFCVWFKTMFRPILLSFYGIVLTLLAFAYFFVFKK